MPSWEESGPRYSRAAAAPPPDTPMAPSESCCSSCTDVLALYLRPRHDAAPEPSSQFARPRECPERAYQAPAVTPPTGVAMSTYDESGSPSAAATPSSMRQQERNRLLPKQLESSSARELRHGAPGASGDLTSGGDVLKSPRCADADRRGSGARAAPNTPGTNLGGGGDGGSGSGCEDGGVELHLGGARTRGARGAGHRRAASGQMLAGGKLGWRGNGGGGSGGGGSHRRTCSLSDSNPLTEKLRGSRAPAVRYHHLERTSSGASEGGRGEDGAAVAAAAAVRAEAGGERAGEAGGGAVVVEQDEDDDFCPTCLEDYTVDNPKIWAECGHHFHMPCIFAWMERKDTCPMCGSKMVFPELE